MVEIPAGVSVSRDGPTDAWEKGVLFAPGNSTVVLRADHCSGKKGVMNAGADELEIIGSDADCAYLPDRDARMHYRLAMSLDVQRYEQLLERGWRRFGRTLFRPVCRTCSECRSLRIDVPAFQATRSQRKALRRNADLKVIVQRPTVTDEHVDLYNSYHQDMQQRRGWPFQKISEDQYYESFLDGQFSFSREFQYRRDGQLVALGIVDMTGTAMSSIYFIHLPELRKNSPGTMSVLHELRVGRETCHRWLYMGYYIADCGSMNYKNRFHPHQLLQHYADDHEPAVWL